MLQERERSLKVFLQTIDSEVSIVPLGSYIHIGGQGIKGRLQFGRTHFSRTQVLHITGQQTQSRVLILALLNNEREREENVILIGAGNELLTFRQSIDSQVLLEIEELRFQALGLHRKDFLCKS